MCPLWNIAMPDYQESVTTGQTHRQTYAGQSDPYVPLCFAGDAKSKFNSFGSSSYDGFLALSPSDSDYFTYITVTEQSYFSFPRNLVLQLICSYHTTLGSIASLSSTYTLTSQTTAAHLLISTIFPNSKLTVINTVPNIFTQLQIWNLWKLFILQRHLCVSK